MSYTQEQFDKLPKWAQSEIKRIDQYTKTLEQRINEFSGQSVTNTYIQDGMDIIPLLNNARIEFTTGHEGTDRVRVCVDRHGMVDINTDSRMGKTAVLVMSASNSFRIHFIS
jgi:hypothetical protein